MNRNEPFDRPTKNKGERIRKALDIIAYGGGIDGAHHKQWCLDQVVRALTGAKLSKMEAVDCNDKPYEYMTQDVSREYLKWVEEFNAGEDGPETYSWDEGIAP